MSQLDIFADTNQGQAADTVAAAKAVEQRKGEARRALFDSAKAALVSDGLYGYPNLIRNPAGPWKAWQGAGATPVEHGLCWPGYYLTAIGSDGVNKISVLFRKGQRRNPALLRTIKLLRTLGPVDVAPIGTRYDTLQYY